MANDLDRFVLQYQVELKDSVSKLEKLHEKMSKVGEGSQKSASDLKKFAADASSEIGKLIPGMNAVGAAVRAMGAEFAVAGAAIGALAIGIKSVIDMRNQFNAQRAAGMQVGVSGARIENWQRAFVRQGGGYVTRDSAMEGIKQFSDMANSAYTDPSRLGKEARLMRMMGVNVGERGQTPTGTSDRLTQLATYLQGKSPGMVQGIAKTLGVDQDWLRTVQRLGPSIGKITDLTAAQVDQYNKGEDTLSKFNAELAKFNEDLNELEMKLGEKVLPAMDKFIQFLTKITDLFNKATNPSSGADHRKYIVGPGRTLVPNPNYVPDGSDAPPKGHFGPGHTWIADPLTPAQLAAQRTSEAQAKQKQQEDQRKADELADKADDANKIGLQTANQMQLAVNMFAGAVQSFSSAINIQQAWAAWAGEIGKANGLPGSSNATGGVSSGSRGLRNNNPGNLEYGPFAKANGATDSDGRFAIFPTPEAGVAAHTALLQKNYLAKGLDTPEKIVAKYAPKSENDQAAYLAYFKSKGFDKNTKINGGNLSSFVSAQEAYESGYGSGHGIGESRSKMNVRSVQQAVADWLHVPLDQVQRGGVTSGDARWATNQIEGGIQNHIYDLQRQLSVAGLPKQNYSKLRMELRDQTRDLGLMRQYSSQVIGRQQTGDRMLTIGEQAIVININGATNPNAVAQEVNDQLRKSINDLVNHYATGVKG